MAIELWKNLSYQRLSCKFLPFLNLSCNYIRLEIKVSIHDKTRVSAHRRLTTKFHIDSLPISESALNNRRPYERVTCRYPLRVLVREFTIMEITRSSTLHKFLARLWGYFWQCKILVAISTTYPWLRHTVKQRDMKGPWLRTKDHRDTSYFRTAGCSRAV